MAFDFRSIAACDLKSATEAANSEIHYFFSCATANRHIPS